MTDEPRWRNGHEIWVECDGCGAGTSINVSEGVMAERTALEDDWAFTMGQAWPGGLAFADVRCPDCQQNGTERDSE